MFENIKAMVSQVFGQAPMPTRPSQRRTLSHGNWSIGGRNQPEPYGKREWGRTRDIGTLPSVVGGILLEGPQKTQYGQVLYPLHKSKAEYRSQVENFDTQETFAIGHQSKGVGTRSPRPTYRTRAERLASGAGSENQTAALDFVRKHSPGSTDVLSRNPQPRPMPLSGQRIQGPITWAILFELLSKFLGEEGAKARMRQMRVW